MTSHHMQKVRTHRLKLKIQKQTFNILGTKSRKVSLWLGVERDFFKIYQSTLIIKKIVRYKYVKIKSYSQQRHHEPG